MLFLTATITKPDLKECLQSLQTDLAHVRVIAKQSDRPNVYLGYKSEKDMELLTSLAWYMKRLKMDGIWAPKCIIYVSSLALAGQVYGEIMYHLHDAAYNGDKTYERRIVSEFHGESEADDQQRVLKGFSDPDGNIRLVIATVAFGMGINIPDISYIIHWGPPSTILDYWQEVGRAGRDNTKAYCHFFGVKSLLAHSSEEMRELTKGIKETKINCLRSHVLTALELPEMEKNYIVKLKKRTGCTSSNKCNVIGDCVCDLCSCCTLCRSTCKCIHKTFSDVKL